MPHQFNGFRDKSNDVFKGYLSYNEVSKCARGVRVLSYEKVEDVKEVANKLYDCFFKEAVDKQIEAGLDPLDTLKTLIAEEKLTFPDSGGRGDDTCQTYAVRMFVAAFSNPEKKAAPKKRPPQKGNSAYPIHDDKFDRLETFTGRKEQLKEIQKLLDEKRCVVLEGIGGIGKSRLAREFAARNEKPYSTKQLVSLKNSENGEGGSSFKDAVLKLQFDGLYDQDKPPDERYSRRKDFLLQHDERTLIIIDDVDKAWADFKEFCDDLRPKLNCHFIITTRLNAFSRLPSLKVEKLSSPEELEELFSRYYEENEELLNRARLPELLNRIEGHTLLIELIAQTMSYERVTVEDMLEWLRDPKSEYKYMDKDEDELKNPKTVIREILLRVKTDDEQKELLRLLTFLPDEGISRTLLLHILNEPGRSRANKPLGFLENHAWVKQEGNQIRIHPVIRTTVQEDIPPEWWEWNVHRKFLKKIWETAEAEKDEKNQISLSLFALNLCEALREKSEVPPDLRGNLREIAERRNAARQYETALRLFKLLDSVKEDVKLEEHIDLHLQIGRLYQKLARYTNAIEHYQVALNMTPRDNWGRAFFFLSGSVFREDGYYDDWRGSCYYSLGVAFRKDGRYKEAEKSFNEALKCYKSQDRIATTRDDLGVVYRHLGEMATGRGESEDYYRKAKEIAEDLLKSLETSGNIKALAASHHRIGCACYGLGEYERALTEHEKAKRLSPGKAVSYNWIGKDLLRLGRLDEAIEQLNKSMDVYEKNLGASHPDIAKSLISLGEYYETIGDLDKAIEKTREAYNIRVKGLRPGHPYIAQAKRRLAELENKAAIPPGQEKRQ